MKIKVYGAQENRDFREISGRLKIPKEYLFDGCLMTQDSVPTQPMLFLPEAFIKIERDGYELHILRWKLAQVKIFKNKTLTN